MCHIPSHKPGVHTKTDADWDRIGTLLQQCDPHGRLRSIHDGTRLFYLGKPWMTHVSMQNGIAVKTPVRAELCRDVYRKPVVYDEVKYEGDRDRRTPDGGTSTAACRHSARRARATLQ